MTRKQFKVGSVATGFNDRKDFIRLSGMFALASGQEIHLSSPRRGGTKTPTSSEEDQLCDIPKVKSNTTSVGTAILAYFVPDDIGLIRESPSLHHLEPFED